MAQVIGVRFREVGKVYYFDPLDNKFEKGDHVIVETVRGMECGEVALENSEVSDEEIVKPLKSVVRRATDADLKIVEENRKKEQEAFDICLQKIADHGLDMMKLVNVEYAFDGKKILFYYTSDVRVDFRELVKDLARVFRTRIELRQIGVRDGSRCRRSRHVRQTVLLQHVYRRFSARVDKDGKGAGALAQSRQDKRHLRQAHVLPKI